VTLVQTQNISLSAPLLKVMTKMIRLIKYIQVNFVDPGLWQTEIGISPTVSALKRNDTKIRFTISPVKTKQIINCFVLIGYIVITTTKSHKGNEFDWNSGFENWYKLLWTIVSRCQGLNNSVGIAPRYGLDVSGIESRWSEVYNPRPDRRWGPHNILYKEYLISCRG
jgi:hypothetical protein